ncbi:MAG: hypothetical protein ACQERB_06750 [Promethearchaeati archaeon]
MKSLKKSLFFSIILSLFLLSSSIFFKSFSNNFNNLDWDKSIDIAELSYNIEKEFFNGTGSNLNVSLFGNRTQSFENLNIKNDNLLISNEISGWNLSQYKLNFSEIKAEKEYVKFETRNDGSLEFSKQNIFYAMSFRIPNTCLLENLSIFLQYPGGTGPGGFNADSTFKVTVYNSTKNLGYLEPHVPIHQLEDEVNFDLSDKNVTQPAKWYQANFKNRILNISKTDNNTFFAVFQSLKYPSGIFGSPGAYIYYAEEQKSDKYNITFYEKTSLFSSWDLIDQKNGMFKVNLAPLNTIAKPQEINLTVFNKPVKNDGIYNNGSFFPHLNNEFHVPIHSPWFGNVIVNMSFEGKFRFDTKSTNYFRAVNGSDVLWNSTLEIQEYNTDFYNKTAKFYKPNYWIFQQAYNNSNISNTARVFSKYIEIKDISNDKLIILYNQRNNIINPTYFASPDKKNWENFEEKEFINASDYINITSTFNNSNGVALLYVYLGDNNQESLAINQDLTENFLNFPLWRPKYNTSILENNTITKINIMTNNGTMAGILSKTVRIHLYKNQTNLQLTSNLKTSYVYGEELNIEAILTSDQNPIIGEIIHFKIIETYSGGIQNEIIINDTTDDEGLARISYSIKNNLESIRLSAYYYGNIDYETAEFSISPLIIRSQLEQFFIDFLPFFIIFIGVIVGLVSYFTIKKHKFKKNMEIWEKKTQLFADVLKIDLILVIHKLSGSTLIQKSFGDIPIDGNLISGFLQAVSSFKYEIKKETEKSEQETILLDYQDYNILLKDEEFIRVALILNSEPSKNLKKSLNEFTIDFEKKYYKDLKQFRGKITPFQEYFMELVNKHFEMSFINPHKINENPPNISINSFQNRILNVAKTLQSEAGDFYISRLLNYLISANPDEPKERFIANIYDLKEYGFMESI